MAVVVLAELNAARVICSSICIFFFTEDPNVFIIPSKDVFQVKLGALWNVTCKATGHPMPFVQWRKEKTQEVVTPKRRAPEVVMLTISPVTEADLGNYTCVAENSQDITTAHVKLGEPVILRPRVLARLGNLTHELPLCSQELYRLT